MRVLWKIQLLLVLCSSHQVAADVIKVPTIAAPPWGVTSSAPKGVLVDLSRKIAAQMSMTPEFHVLPYKRVHAMVRQCFSGFVLMPDHPAIREISEEAGHLRDLEVVLYSRKDKRISGVSELEGGAVGLILGTQLIPEINRNGSIRKNEVEHPEQMVNMLVQKKVDAIIGLRPNCGLLPNGSTKACVELETVFHASHVRHVSLIAWTPICAAGRSIRPQVKEAVRRLRALGSLVSETHMN